jgi:KDO2-lipid IV(A) lauroyltransferase
MDQDAGPKGLFVPYFGKLASTHSGAGMIAALANCSVLMVFAIRTSPRKFEYKIFTEKLDPPADLGDTDANVLAWTRLMTESIERMARRFPEQVLWPHRRWKTRPPANSKESEWPNRPPIRKSNKLANPPFSLDRRGAS